MGFSDHIPFRCADGYEAIGVRVLTEQAADYVRDLRILREKYRDRIEIHIGFETEYFPEQFAAMLENARNWGAEYLILGQHYVMPEHPNGRHSNIPTEDVTALQVYAQSVIAAMKTGLFTYVAHPDVFHFTGDTQAYREAMRPVCAASKMLNVPLEINFYGIRDKRYYPNEVFWQIAGEERAPVTFGFDSHDVSSAFDGASLAKAQQLVEKYGLNYIGKPSLVPIR
jgi:histidinol-phosphatase (PHP family)